MSAAKQARMDQAADRDARSQTSREIDEAFERLNAAEAAVAQAHIDAARDLQRLFEDMLK